MTNLTNEMNIALFATECAAEAWINISEESQNEAARQVGLNRNWQDGLPMAGDWDTLVDELGREPTDEEDAEFTAAYLSAWEELASNLWDKSVKAEDARMLKMASNGANHAEFAKALHYCHLARI